METKNERLFSLDVLRGLDMMLLMVVGPLFGACTKIWNIPEGARAQFSHAWGCFALWDIIMPLFIFMCGAAVPLALPKRMENGRAGAKYWKHVISRIVLLWILGMICQGNLLTLDPAKIALFTNTLQAIAVGYLIAAFAQPLRNARVRQALPFVLVAVYAILMAFCGDYSQQGNIAYVFEKKLETVLPFIGYTLAGNYTWFLTSFMFGAMTLFGAQATEILIGEGEPKRKCGRLALYGAVLLAVGWVLVFCGIPMIKHVYSASFTLQAMGWSMLALAALYGVCDVMKLRRGTWIFVLFGQCALFAYMIGGCFRGALMTFSKQALGGVPHWLGDRWQPLVVQIGACVLLTLLLCGWRRLKRAGRTA